MRETSKPPLDILNNISAYVYGLKEQNALWRLHVFVHNIIETLWCYKCTLLSSLEIFLVKKQFSDKSQCFYGSPYGIKEHKMMKCLWATILLKSPIRRVLYI